MAEKMRCPDCKKRLYVHHHYPVKGVRYGGIAGRVRVYRCECGHEERTLEVKADSIEAHDTWYKEKIQEYIKRDAAQKQKIAWLKSPIRSGQTRIDYVRAKLIEILDGTY